MLVTATRPSLSSAPQSYARPAAAASFPTDSISLSRGSGKALWLGLGAAGAVGGGLLAHHFTSGLTGIASHLAGAVGGGLAIGLGGAIAGAFIFGRGNGFEGLAGAYAGAMVGGGVGLAAGVLTGALVGPGAASTFATLGGVIGGTAVGLVLANGLTK